MTSPQVQVSTQISLDLSAYPDLLIMAYKDGGVYIRYSVTVEYMGRKEVGFVDRSE